MSQASNQIVIDANEFLAGMNTDEHTKDGGFSQQSEGVNLIGDRGVLNAPGELVDASTNLTNEIIATCEDPSYLGQERMVLDESGAFYYFKNGTLTKKVTVSSATVSQGTTDFVPFSTTGEGLRYYATTSAGANGDIIRWDGVTTLTENWWTSTLSQSALQATTPQRPLLVYERNLYVGDRNLLHRIDEGKVVSNGILTLQSSETITAMEIDPGSGKMLIATNTGSNFSGTKEGESKIHVYDGFSNKPSRTIRVSGLVTSFKSVGGIIYIFFQNKIGVWNGSGYTFLRRLNYTLSGSYLTYKHRVAVIDETLYFADGQQIIAFGYTRRGQNVFYPVIDINTDIVSLANVGDNQLGVSYETNQFKTFDVTDISQAISGGSEFRSLWYSFPRNIEVKSVIIEYSSPLPTSAEQHAVLRIKNDKGASEERVISNTAGELSLETNITVISRKIQLRYTFAPSTATNTRGVVRFIINFDPISV
jgi:hypothetical protein